MRSVGLILWFVCSMPLWSADLALSSMPDSHLILPTTLPSIRLLLRAHPSHHASMISLNFRDIPVRTLLQILAERAKVNMVLSDQITGKMTLRLTKVPWDRALKIILMARDLSQQRLNGVIMIVPTSAVSQHPDQHAMVSLDSTLIAFNHVKASMIMHLLKESDVAILSSRGTVSVNEHENTLWVQDLPSHLQRVKKLVQQLDQPVQQILIESRIVEITKESAQELGMQFVMGNRLQQSSSPASGMLGAVSDGGIQNSGKFHLDLGQGAALVNPSSAMGFAVNVLGGNILLDLELSALESEHKAMIIARPRLMTADRQEASIESGEEIPYQQSTVSGATAVSFKKAVLSLKVTPVMMSDGRIQMTLKMNQDRPSTTLFNGAPAIVTKEIATRVVVKAGQTIVLGGIYRRDKMHRVARIPFLGSLPVLGAWFRRTASAVRDEELLVFITPHLMEAGVNSIETNKEVITGYEYRKSS